MMSAADSPSPARVNVGVRIPQDWFDRLEALETVTEKSRTTLLLEAIGSYLGEDVETVCDRIQALEQEVADLKQKFQQLASLGR